MTPLLYFLTRLRGDTVTVELKNGTQVTGTVQRVDNEMNVYLLNVSVVCPSDTRAPSAAFDTLAAPVLQPWDKRSGEPAPIITETGSQRLETAKEYRVRGSTIRYIVLPETLNMEAALRAMHKFARRKRSTQNHGKKPPIGNSPAR